MAFSFAESVAIDGPSVHGGQVPYAVQRIAGKRYIRLEKNCKCERLLGIYNRVNGSRSLPKTTVLERLVALRNQQWQIKLMQQPNSDVRMKLKGAAEARSLLLEDTVTVVHMPSYGDVPEQDIEVVLKMPHKDQCPTIELTVENLVYLRDAVKWEIDNADDAMEPRTKRGTKARTVEKGITLISPDKIQVRVKVQGVGKIRRKTVAIQDGDREGAVETARNLIHLAECDAESDGDGVVDGPAESEMATGG